MSKKTYSLWILGFITLIICSYFSNMMNRYYINDGNGDISYKINQWTGKTWALQADRQAKIGDEEIAVEVTSKEDVIKVVKNDKTISSISNKYEIKFNLEDLKGDMKVSGWKAEKVDDQVYLVSYEYQHQGDKKGYYFEYNTKADLIRNVLSDQELQAKYDVDPLRSP